MWLDLNTGVIYYAEANSDITDFSSTPAGDGHKGVLRGCGRLHDLMDESTPILRPSGVAQERLLERVGDHEAGQVHGYLTIDQVVRLGYQKSTEKVSIWEAGGLYHRMLITAGFSRIRAAIHRFGLRGLGIHYFYRWVWHGAKLEYLSERAQKL